jgi:hypothetical protein
VRKILTSVVFLGVLLTCVSCKPIKEALGKASQGEVGESTLLGEAAVDPNWPVSKELAAVTPQNIAKFVSGGNRVSVVEFYSDT